MRHPEETAGLGPQGNDDQFLNQNNRNPDHCPAPCEMEGARPVWPRPIQRRWTSRQALTQGWAGRWGGLHPLLPSHHLLQCFSCSGLKNQTIDTMK